MVAEGKRTAFVFAGGGSLGAIQVGMLRALLARGVNPDFVVGSSVGAINAAYFAGHPDSDGVAGLERIWTGLRRSDVFPFSVRGAFAMWRHPGSIVDPSYLRRLIEQHLPYTRLDDARLPVHIMACDQQGVGARLSSGPALPAILASAAVPGIFPPVEIGGRMLMDGAIAANTPLRLAADLGASRIVVLPTGYACALKEPPRSVIGRALHAITLLIAWQLMHELEHIADGVEVFLAPALCPLDVSPYDFTSSRALIERAAATTAKWIDGGGLERRARSSELAPHHHHH